MSHRHSYTHTHSIKSLPSPTSPASSPSPEHKQPESGYRASTKKVALAAPPSPPNSASPTRSAFSAFSGGSHAHAHAHEESHDPWTDPHHHPSSSTYNHIPRYLMSLDHHALPASLDASWRMEPTLSQESNNPRAGRDAWSGAEGVVAGPSSRPTVSAPATIGYALGGRDARRSLDLRDVREKTDGTFGSGGLGGKRPMPTAVWADVMDSSKGRDKVLKCVQYTLRTYLYILSLLSTIHPLPRWFRSNQKRMKLAITGLSLSRKCLLLLNPLHPLTELLSPAPMSASTMFGHLLDLISALADDLYCLGKLGVVSRRLARRADEWANRLWLLSTLMGLCKLHLKTIPKLRAKLPISSHHQPALTGATAISADEAKTQKDLSDAKWTNRKLLADLVFVSYDVFDMKWFSEPVQCVAGLTAALIATSKLYDKHWVASLGK